MYIYGEAININIQQATTNIYMHVTWNARQQNVHKNENEYENPTKDPGLGVCVCVCVLACKWVFRARAVVISTNSTHTPLPLSLPFPAGSRHSLLFSQCNDWAPVHAILHKNDNKIQQRQLLSLDACFHFTAYVASDGSPARVSTVARHHFSMSNIRTH